MSKKPNYTPIPTEKELYNLEKDTLSQNRRTHVRRSNKKVFYKGKNKREFSIGRRIDEKSSTFIHVICLVIFGATILLVGLASFLPVLKGLL